MAASHTGWAEQQVDIVGAQIEYVVDLQLADVYRLEDSQFVAANHDDEVVRLAHGDTGAIRLSFPDELSPGVHIFDLAIPVWINASEVVLDDPDDRIEITLTYTVQSGDERQAVSAFCQEAIPISDGRTPTFDELDELSRIAEAELERDNYQALSNELKELREDLNAYQSGAGDGYSTSDVNDVIGRICNVNMRSISEIGD